MGAENIIKEFLDSTTNNQNENFDIFCPFCKKGFHSLNPSTFNKHIRICGIKRIQISKSCDLYPPSQDIVLNDSIFNYQKNYFQNQRFNFIDKSFDIKIKDLKEYFIQRKKNLEFKPYTLDINRQYLLKEAIDKTKGIFDIYKEWKINFIGEVSYDAGGILREFFTNVFQTLENDKLKLFIISDSNDFSYILNPFLFKNNENYSYCQLIGILIAKALIENITINICFNKIIYKMILEEKILFDDLVFIDTSLYNSLKNLKENLEYNKLINPNIKMSNIIKDLELFYAIEINDCNNHLHSFELIPNGRKIYVENLDDFIEKRINFLIGIYEPFIQIIRETLFSFIPKDKIKAFTSNELELILNGRPYIDLEEWKLYTIYKTPYNPKHKVIKWFWEILEKLTQKQLSNLLLFSTGSSRVPLGGFAELESNRGNLSQFTIEYVAYNPQKKNYIKAHTCFNRIDLPCFTHKNELEEAIRFVSEHEMWGFGIE